MVRSQKPLVHFAIVFCAMLSWSVPAHADTAPMINPAEEAKAPTTAPSGDASTVQMPAITVVGQPVSNLREEDRIGSYQQPRWTADRRFPGVRVFVIPENTFEFEYWVRADISRHGPTRIQHMFEAEIGLPYRFQLDLYAIARSDSGGSSKTFFDQQVEVRWAVADWGKIPGNPTFYLEYANREDSPDKIEAKLLLGGELGQDWHWGQNLLFEGETGGEREYEYGWTGGLSCTLIDNKLSVGAEAQVSFFDVRGDRGSYSHEVFLGPSVQFRPTPRMHLDLAPLFGIGSESPAAKVFFVFGYQF